MDSNNFLQNIQLCEQKATVTDVKLNINDDLDEEDGHGPHNTEFISWKAVPVSQIKMADHICWWCGSYFRHAIVIHIEVMKYILTVIGWKFCPDTRRVNQEPTLNPEIIQDEVEFTDDKTIYKAMYKYPCFNDDEVLQRAHKHIGDTDYHVIENYARAFPRYCKTGYGGLTFVHPEQRGPSWKKTKIQSIEVGSHICFWNYAYYKHGIVTAEWASNERQSPKKGNITIISWKMRPPKKIIEHEVTFKRNHKVYLAIYSNAVKYAPTEVVKRAQSRVDEQNYDVIKNYARAFPRWCVTGYGGIFTGGEVWNK